MRGIYEIRAVNVFREYFSLKRSISTSRTGKFMRNLNKFIISLTALAIVIGVGMYLNHRPDPPAPQPDHPGNVMAPTTNRPIVHAQRPFLASESPQGTKPTNFLTLPPEKVEEYLQRHNRDAASLLAGFHVLHDTNLLYEAVTNFPNDPHLQWTVLARNLFPEDRRKWLDNFKTSAPGNSLANYLSASDYFQNHQPEAAMKEINAAAGKSQFADYSMETILDSEDLYRFGGRSPGEIRTAAMANMGEDVLPELSQIKGVARGLQDLQHQYANSGDAASVQAIAQMGVEFANKFTTGNSTKFIITELVGNASQAVVLESLDQNTSYPFLGGETPAQKLADIKQEKTSLQNLNKAVAVAVTQASDDQMNAYWERMKIYGEMPAMQWLVQQTTATPNTGN